jgi:hypothetical protein
VFGDVVMRSMVERIAVAVVSEPAMLFLSVRNEESAEFGVHLD